jgi:hypothetical protein
MSLTPQQLKALSMFAQGASGSEIANELKVSARSIQRWQKLPEFAKGLYDISAKTTQLTVETTASSISNRIQRLLPKALDTIEYYIENPEAKASDRLRACHLVGTWAGLTQQKIFQDEAPQASAGLSDELVSQIRRQVLGVNNNEN